MLLASRRLSHPVLIQSRVVFALALGLALGLGLGLGTRATLNGAAHIRAI
jgi:hypothetical protein